MKGENPLDIGQRIDVRDAAEADLNSLVEIKGAGSEALHLDRLRDAQGGDMRYLVLIFEGELIAFTLLVMRRPVTWSDSSDTTRLPQVVDLQVKENRSGRGFGTAFLREIERRAAQDGFERILFERGTGRKRASLRPLHASRLPGGSGGTLSLSLGIHRLGGQLAPR